MDYEPWLSASQVNMFLRCARQWAFRYIEKLKRPPAGVMKQSEVFHTTAEHNYRQKIDSHRDLPLDEQTDFFVQEYDAAWEREEVQLREDENKGDLRAQGLDVVKEHHRNIAPKVQPILVEQVFDLRFPVPGQADYGFRLKGKIDVVDDRLIIRDQKAYAKTPTEWELARDLQLSTYALARSMELKELQPQLSMDVVVKTVVPQAKILPAVRSREGLRMHLNTIGNVAKAIRADAFPRNPTGWWCSPKWCGYWDLCMGKGLVTIDLGEHLESQLKESIERVEQAKKGSEESGHEGQKGGQEGGGQAQGGEEVAPEEEGPDAA